MVALTKSSSDTMCLIIYTVSTTFSHVQLRESNAKSSEQSSLKGSPMLVILQLSSAYSRSTSPATIYILNIAGFLFGQLLHQIPLFKSLLGFFLSTQHLLKSFLHYLKAEEEPPFMALTLVHFNFQHIFCYLKVSITLMLQLWPASKLVVPQTEPFRKGQN